VTSAEKKAIQYKKLIVDVKADLDSVQTKSGRICELAQKINEKELSEELDEYRRFRHMFRHAYGAELRWGKMKLMAQEISSIMEELNKSISMAIIFLEDLIGNLEQ